MPIEVQSILLDNSWFAKLLSRRDQVNKASDEFYKLANQYVDIYLSDKSEYVEVTRFGDSFTFVEVFKRDKKTGVKKNDIVYIQKI